MCSPHWLKYDSTHCPLVESAEIADTSLIESAESGQHPPPPPLVESAESADTLLIESAKSGQHPPLVEYAESSDTSLIELAESGQPPPPPPPLVESAESGQGTCIRGCQMVPPCPILAPPSRKAGAAHDLCNIWRTSLLKEVSV